MKRINQIVLPNNGKSYRDDGEPGDCLRACVASILEYSGRDYMNLPNYASLPEKKWWIALRLSVRNLTTLDIAPVPRNELERIRIMTEKYDYWPKHCIISGPSPRGNFWHSVVGNLDGTIEHDPHPSREGLAGSDRSYLVFCAPYEFP